MSRTRIDDGSKGVMIPSENDGLLWGQGCVSPMMPGEMSCSQLVHFFLLLAE